MTIARLFLLGPQTPQPNLAAALDALGCAGPLVVITAGWRDNEGEIDELSADIGRPLEDLRLYQRAEDVFAREPGLRALQRERQDRLTELQGLYRMRLGPALLAARTLLRAEGTPELLRLEQRAAIAAVRALDRHHVRRIAAIHADFDARRARLHAPFATAQREAVHGRIERAAAVLIAGGHVAVLLNRIRLFRLEPLLARKPLLAWSAGAMVLSERIVLFHDNAPQGTRDPEVLDAGLGIARRLVPLPDARTRLKGSGRTRLALLSRRFAPALCCTLDNGAWLTLEDGALLTARNASALLRTGRRRRLDPVP